MKTKNLQQLETALNEERWTSTTVTNYTTSAFKELDELIETLEEDDITTAITIAEEHLKNTKNSIGAHYVAGILSFQLNNDEDMHLTKLTQLFFEHNKKNLVEYIMRKTLTISENLLALRTLAVLLKEKNDSQELQKILQRIVKIDPHDADSMYELALMKQKNGVLQGSITDYKRALYRFIEKKHFSHIRDIWNILIDLNPHDIDFFYHAAGKVSETLADERAVQLMQLLHPVFSKNESVDKVIYLLKKILTLQPTNEQAREWLIAAYEKKYADRSNLKKYLQESNLAQTWRNIHEAISDFEKHISFDVGNFVEHKSWGVGIIRSVEKNSILIDFAKKRNHHMLFNMAITSLEVLSKNHIHILKSVIKKEILNKKIKENPVWALRIILSSYSEPIDLKIIRNELVPTLLNQKEWLTWGSKARDLLRTKSIFRVFTEEKERFTLRDAPLAFHSDYLFEQFQIQKEFKTRLKRILDSISHIADFTEEQIKSQKFQSIYQYFTHIAYQKEKNARSISALILLEELASANKFLTLKKEKTVAYIYPSLENPVHIFSELPFLRIKKFFIAMIPKVDPKWKITLIKLFPYHVSKDIFRLFAQYNCKECVGQLFTYFLEHALENRYLFIWLVCNLPLKAETTHPSLDTEKVIILMISIHTVCQREIKSKINVTENRKAIKQINKYLFLENHLFTFLQEAKKQAVHKVYTLLCDSSHGFETKNIIQVEEKVQKRFPDLIKKKSLKTDEDGFLATLSSFKKYQEEFTYLSEVEIPQNSKEIEKARAYGDLKENAEYKAALERQTAISLKIKKLHTELQTVKLVKKSDVTTSVVRFGTRIRLQNMNDSNNSIEYSILGPWESDPDKNIISYKSPFGHSLLDKKVNDELELTLEGNTRKYRIAEISLADF